MKLLELRKFGCALAAAAGLLTAISGGAFAQGVKNSINLAVGALPPIGDANATVLMVEYERLVGTQVSVFARGSSLKYKWDDGNYVEDGKGTGVGVGTRFFPQGGLKGFYIGAAVAAFDSKWDWTEKSPVGSGRGTTKSDPVGRGAWLPVQFGLRARIVDPGIQFWELAGRRRHLLEFERFTVYQGE